MLKAGFSRVDITPPLGSFIAGYFRDRYAKGILDPIYLNAVAVTDGAETAVIITADILYLTAKYADEVRALIEERTGIPQNHVMISSLHQHTSIAIRDNEPHGTVSDKAYMDILYRKFADAALLALDDMKEASLSRAERETEKPIAFIRRYVMKDGSIATNPGVANKDNIARPCDISDNTVRLLRFKRREGNDIAFVNFSTHPDVVGGEMLSADWPGFVRRFVERDLEGVSCLLLNGAQGDSNHLDYMSGTVGRGYGHSEYMGRMIADAVLKIWDETTPCDNISVNADMTDVYNRTRTDGEERYEECKRLLDEHALDKNSKKFSITELGEASRIVGLRHTTIYRRLPVTAISLGEVAIVGFGGEPFTHYATAVREACPDRYIIASCCANGGEGYLPTAAAFAEGGYEASASYFSPTLESECVTAAAELLKKM